MDVTLEAALEAKRVFRISFRKLEDLKVPQRVSRSLCRSVLINAAFNRTLRFVQDVQAIMEDEAESSALDSQPVEEMSAEPKYLAMEDNMSFDSEDPPAVPEGRRAAAAVDCEPMQPAVQGFHIRLPSSPDPPEPVEVDVEDELPNRRGVKRAAEFDSYDNLSFKRFRRADENEIDSDDEQPDSAIARRAHSDLSEAEDEEDPNDDVMYRCNMGVVYWDENAPAEGPPIASLVTVFGSGFHGLGGFGSAGAENSLVRSRYSSRWDNRSQSMPNLCAKPKKKKNGPVVIRI